MNIWRHEGIGTVLFHHVGRQRSGVDLEIHNFFLFTTEEKNVFQPCRHTQYGGRGMVQTFWLKSFFDNSLVGQHLRP